MSEQQNTINHIAFIMDGNGRWAQNQGLARYKGHQEGAKKVEEVTMWALEQGISYITLFAFSTENWNRPKKEVDFLMDLFEKYLNKEGSFYIKNDVRFRVIGDRTVLKSSIIKKIASIEEQTSKHKTITQVLAVNYGSKDEIVRSAQKLQEQNIPITEESLQNSLDTADIPDVDIYVRTGGHCRLSNYLLWQSAYAELFFLDTLWPDFAKSELDEIVQKYKLITRNFGAV